MTHAQWLRLEDLFERGLDQPESVREALLLECADDVDVQEQLQILWRHEAEHPEFLDTPVAPPVVLETRRLLAAEQRLSDRFTILELIGTGGMGEVYRARDERLGRIVAVKVLSYRLASDTLYRQRLEQEARAVSLLAHPHICTLHDLDTDGELLFLVMEYVEGETLEARLQRGALPQETVAGIALEICAGLQHAHQAGLIHRDLKPANVILSPHGVKLLDFGVASRGSQGGIGKIEKAAGLSLTGAGLIAGTPAYMSPEQQKGQPLDARSDLYSFGLVLREMIRAAAENPAVRPDPLIARLEAISLKCLEDEPGRRFASAADLREALQQADVRPGRRSGHWRWLVAAVTLALALAGAAQWYSRQTRPARGAPRLSMLTAYPGSEYSPTLSPDGKKVAFLWDGEEANFDVWVKDLGSDRPTRLTRDPAPEHTPKWSPDGRWIAFERKGQIRLVAPEGGPERFVVNADHLPRTGCDDRLTWSGDSAAIIFPRALIAGGPPALHRIELATGEIRQLTRPSVGSRGHGCPVAAPDNRQVFYVAAEQGNTTFHIADVDAGGMVRRERRVPWLRGRFHTWTPDSRELIFSRELPAAPFLFRASASQEESPRQLPFGEEAMFPVVSRDGQRLVYMRRHLDAEIWREDLETGGVKSTPAPQKLIESSRLDTQPEYSPDGQRLAFYTERSGTGELWLADAGGRNAKRLTAEFAGQAQPRWSPDGSRIVYSVKGDLFVVAATGDAYGKPILLRGGRSVDTAPSFSRDGRAVYFTSDQSGRREVWRMPAEGGEAVPVTIEGALAGLESFDGRQLFLVREVPNEQNRLYVRPVGGGAMLFLSEVPARLAMTVNQRGLYFLASQHLDDWPVLSLYPGRSGPLAAAIQPLRKLPKRERYVADGLAVAASRNEFAYALFDLLADLVMVENFQ